MCCSSLWILRGRCCGQQPPNVFAEEEKQQKQTGGRAAVRFSLVVLERRFFGFNGKKKLETDTRLFVFNGTARGSLTVPVCPSKKPLKLLQSPFKIVEI